MKLKSGCIFWPQIYRGEKPVFPSLDRDLRCEVAILGGGISGALIGYYLIRAGIGAVLVDRRPIGEGSTAASTGLLQYEIDTPLVELTERIGHDRAVTAYRASENSVRAFEPLVAELDDSCGLIARSSLYLASEENDVETFRAECDARRAMGIDAQFLSGDALRDRFNLSRPAAILSSLAFEVDPYRLTQQLIRHCVRQGLKVFTGTEITNIQPNCGGIILHTACGARIEAQHLVFATGYETMVRDLLGLCRLSSTYAFCSEPVVDLSPWREQCLIWESARPYLYMRTAEGGRIMVGGEDEEIVDPSERDRLINLKAETLRIKFSKLFPEIQIDVSCAWAGTFAGTKDGMPYIGTLPKFPRCFFALGYGGNGITFSLLAAEMLRDLFLRRPDPRTALFGFGR
jgi:glycine/D-amino acid oxidase-like deaminating enzyme